MAGTTMVHGLGVAIAAERPGPIACGVVFGRKELIQDRIVDAPVRTFDPSVRIGRDGYSLVSGDEARLFKLLKRAEQKRRQEQIRANLIRLSDAEIAAARRELARRFNKSPGAI